MRVSPKVHKPHTLLCSTLLSLLLAISSPAQTDQYERWNPALGEGWEQLILPAVPREELENLKSRWEAIGQELARTPTEAAGTYYGGGEMRQSLLRWAPDNGFVFVYVYERFSVLDFSYGRVTVTPAGVTFIVEREQRTTAFSDSPRRTPIRWVPARWMSSKYMIPAEEISAFGNYVAGLGGYNSFNGPCCVFTPFLVTDARNSSAGEAQRPVVPQPYRRFIREPIEGIVIRVGRRRLVRNYVTEGEFFENLHQRAALTPVRINAGRRQGVTRRLFFRMIGYPIGQYLMVTRVGERSSQAVVILDVDEQGRPESCYDPQSFTAVECPAIRVGIRVTTGPR